MAGQPPTNPGQPGGIMWPLFRPSQQWFTPLACPRSFASPARTQLRLARTHDTNTKPKPIS
eukprot:13077926-Alexandrium_andersonii.AAC.1